MEAIVESRLHWADRPLWVRIGLFGVPSRTAALAWVWVCIASAIGFLVGVAALFWWVPTLFVGPHGFSFAMYLGAMSLVAWVALGSSALLYGLTIQWVDEHDGWALVRRPVGRRESHAAPALRDQTVAPMTQ
jgi:hypothetical protein